MFKKVKTNVEVWKFMQLRIFKKYLLIGCGGDDRAALPILQEFVSTLNEIRAFGGYKGDLCELRDEGGYISIHKLEGFSTQAGWLLVGMRLKEKWEISRSEVEYVHKSTKDGSIEEVFIVIMDNYPKYKPK